MNPKRCFKTNVAGVTLYLSLADSKLTHTEKTLVGVSDLVKVEAPGFSNDQIPALEMAEQILRYIGVGVADIGLSVCIKVLKSVENHPFLPDKYMNSVSTVGAPPIGYKVVDYVLPIAEAKRLAAEYLQSMKSRNPQDPC